jgi:hypothetical protein
MPPHQLAGGVVVENLSQFLVGSFQDCKRLLDEGAANRTVGATAMNNQSSRSHSVFTVEITGGFGGQRNKIQLVDLAGSVRICLHLSQEAVCP